MAHSQRFQKTQCSIKYSFPKSYWEGRAFLCLRMQPAAYRICGGAAKHSHRFYSSFPREPMRPFLTTTMASAAILVPQQHRRSPSPATPARNDSHRHSHLSANSLVSSSAASFKTAPLSAASHTSLALSTSSHSSSVHTIRDAEGINPIYSLASGQEMHIVKVTSDTVQIEAGPIPDSYFGRVGKTVLRAVQHNGDAQPGPPPPSPPASVERVEEDSESFPTIDQSHMRASPEPIHTRTASGADSLQDHSSISSSRFNTIRPPQPQEPPLQRSSTDTRTSLRTVLTNPNPVPIQGTQSTAEASTSRAAHLSVDGHLQPPVTIPYQRPTRRNTTGSTPLGAKRITPGHGKGVSQPSDDTVLGEGSVELASDIEMHAERIRRERNAKRAKQQQEAEAALTRAESSAPVNPDQPLVGNLIGEDHVNYVLMYNMLTGIRIGVRQQLLS